MKVMPFFISKIFINKVYGIQINLCEQTWIQL